MQTFFQKKIYKWSINTWQMLNDANMQGNNSKLPWQTAHSSRVTRVKMTKKPHKHQHVYEERGTQRAMGTLASWWWKYTLAQPIWRTIWGFTKNWTQSYYDTLIPLLDIYIQRNYNHRIKEISVLACLLQHYS